MGEMLKGKVAIVTGAGRGIGRAYAHALAAEGARVVVNDLPAAPGQPGAADAVAAEIVEAGGRAVAHDDSVADFTGAGRLVQAAIEHFGRLDILIANAAIIRPKFLADADEHDWSDVLAVATNGTFNCVHHAIPRMIEAGGGSIVMAGDLVTDILFPRNAAYRVAKAANVVLATYAADELREYGINVNAVNPGATATQMSASYFESLGDHAERFLAQMRKHVVAVRAPAAPETVPPLGVYLCSDQGHHITGCAFQLNGTSIGLAMTHTELAYLDSSDGEAWTAEGLGEQLPAWLTRASAAAV